FQAEDGIRDRTVTGVQTCALPIFRTSAELIIETETSRIDASSIFIDGNSHVSKRQLVRSMHFHEIRRSARCGSRESTLSGPGDRAFSHIALGHTDDRELR